MGIMASGWCSMIEETKAANSGVARPSPFDSSGWMKLRLWKGCLVFSIQSSMCALLFSPVWRWVATEGAAISSLLRGGGTR